MSSTWDKTTNEKFWIQIENFLQFLVKHLGQNLFFHFDLLNCFSVKFVNHNKMEIDGASEMEKNGKNKKVNIDYDEILVRLSWTVWIVLRIWSSEHILEHAFEGGGETGSMYEQS